MPKQDLRLSSCVNNQQLRSLSHTETGSPHSPCLRFDTIDSFNFEDETVSRV